MRPIDCLIILLFLPTIIFAGGYTYMNRYDLCGPIPESIFCFGFNGIVELFVIPVLIFTLALGMFFFCRRCRTEEI